MFFDLMTVVRLKDKKILDSLATFFGTDEILSLLKPIFCYKKNFSSPTKNIVGDLFLAGRSSAVKDWAAAAKTTALN